MAKGDKSRYNPANVNVTIVEIKHEPDRFDLRGGAKTAEHVDILGSAELNELVLTVAAGKGHTIQIDTLGEKNCRKYAFVIDQKEMKGRKEE